MSSALSPESGDAEPTGLCRTLGIAAPQGFSSLSLWMQEGSAPSFASRREGGELSQAPLSAAEGVRAPWLRPSFHPHA